ncbi:hypothetical protein [Helicobacter rodentium]|uniref:hypothetical protein n=2 Tax=Helicobacter rodentium TaxID=59617 RepID=UPI0023F58656|nr:hypothetical protein [Helicobacter rodentium]
MLALMCSLALLFGLLIQMLIIKNMKYPYGGSDHAMHYKIIQAIKNSHHRFFITHCHPAYPKLYHFICSFFGNEFLLKKANYISYIFAFLIFCLFFAFVYCNFILGIVQIDRVDIILITLLFATMPITYVVWNAKFTGLSARAFGLFLNYCYSMSLFFYLLYGDFYLFGIVLLFVFLQLISSQFAFQFVIFSSIFISVVTAHYEMFLVAPLGAFFLFVLNYQYAKSFFYGQLQHKRNYSKFMIKDCQFKQRYSIWRDFVYDFWVKKDRAYIFNNPVFEVLFGAFPHCFILVYYWFVADVSDTALWILYVLLSSSFFAFFVTSLRVGRFLGEPQRYIEFGIPFACILCVALLPSWLVLLFVVFNFIMLKWYMKNSQIHRERPEHVRTRECLIGYLQNIFDKEYAYLVSNDSQTLKYFWVTHYKTCMPDYAKYYKNKEEFLLYYDKGNYNRLSPHFVAEKIKQHKRGILILYTNTPMFYDKEVIMPLLNNIALVHLKDVGRFKIFRFSEMEVH